MPQSGVDSGFGRNRIVVEGRVEVRVVVAVAHHVGLSGVVGVGLDRVGLGVEVVFVGKPTGVALLVVGGVDGLVISSIGSRVGIHFFWVLEAGWRD